MREKGGGRGREGRESEGGWTESERYTHRERDRETEFELTLFYKDCSLGSVKTCLTTSPCYTTDEYKLQ